MSRCIKCNINVLDDAVMCPLCHRVLERSVGTASENDAKSEQNEEEDLSFAIGKHITGDLANHGSHSVMYPDVEPAMKKLRKSIRIVVFASILVEVIALLINYMVDFDVKWSLVVGEALIYACFTLVYSAEKTKSLQKKLVVQLVGAMILIVLVDLTLDFFGWSLSYGNPSLILGVDIAIFVLMRVDTVNWQNYIMAQIWILVISLTAAIPIMLGMVQFPLLAIIAAMVSAFSLIGTIVFGDKRAETEIKRRFHI